MPTESGRLLSMPHFRARVLDSQDLLTDEDCYGRETLFLFFRSTDGSSLRKEVFEGIVYALWGKIEECLYIVCSGSEVDCRLLRDHYNLRQRYGESIKILLDDSLELAEIFNVESTPSAIVYDENGKEEKRGYLSEAAENQSKSASGQPLEAQRL